MKKTLNFLLISIFSINNSVKKEEISEKKSKNKAIKKKRIRILSNLQLKNKILKIFKEYFKGNEVDEVFKYLDKRKLLKIIHEHCSKKNIFNSEAYKDLLTENMGYDKIATKEFLDCYYNNIFGTINYLNKSPLIKHEPKNLTDYTEILKYIFEEVVSNPGAFYFFDNLPQLIKNLNESLFKNHKEKYINLLNEIFVTDFTNLDLEYYNKIISDLNESPLKGDLDKYEAILKDIITYDDYFDKNGIMCEEIKLLNKKIKNPYNYYNIIKKIYETKHGNNLERQKILNSLKDSHSLEDPNEEENMVVINNFLDK